MVRREEIEKQLFIHNRRLQKLKEIEAIYGISTDPSTLIEIEIIESKIFHLERELQELQDHGNDLAFEARETALPPYYSLDYIPVQLTLHFDLSEFTEVLKYSIIRTIARILRISPDQIRSINVRSGSVLLTLEMPVKAAERLVTLYDKRNETIQGLQITKIELLKALFDPYSLSLSMLSAMFASKSIVYFQYEKPSVGKIQKRIERKLYQLAQIIYEYSEILTEFADLLKVNNVLYREFQSAAVQILVDEDELIKIDKMRSRAFRVNRVFSKVLDDLILSLSPAESDEFILVMREVEFLLRRASIAQDYQSFLLNLKSSIGYIYDHLYDLGKVYVQDNFDKIFQSSLFENWENGETKPKDRSTSRSSLFTSPPSELIWRIPIVSDITAGLGIITEDSIRDYIFLDKREFEYANFGVRVVGDSMSGDGILPGDIALIHRQPMVNNGQIAAIVITTPQIETLGVIKRYYVVHQKRRDLAHWLFESSNPASKHLVVTPSGYDSKAIRDFYTERIKAGKITNPIEFYDHAEIAIAGIYVGLVRKKTNKAILANK